MNPWPAPAITVYIPCRNYGRYLSQAIESVLRQTRADWELILINDGSQDNTQELALRFEAEHPGRIRLIRHETARGLQASANTALSMARGKYFIRLDADDLLDDNALLILANHLDQHPSIALVYPNYLFIDEQGHYLGIEHRKRIGQESELLDLPAHGAGTMVRTQILRQLGGYDEEHKAQDGYELWLKILPEHGIAHVATPLFHYRQHSTSHSKDQERLLEARRRIKQAMRQARGGFKDLKIAAIVQAKNTYASLPNVVLTELAGTRLIDYTLRTALASELFGKILVSTDDLKVVEHCQGLPAVKAMLRSPRLSGDRVHEAEVACNAVEYLEREMGYLPDIVVLLSVHAPLRGIHHIQEAIDTLLLFEADSVISVCEDTDLHFVHGPQGLTPLNPAMHRQIRLEREGLYESNGAVRALWRRILTPQDISGEKVAHITMSRQESFQIKTPFDLELIEHLLKKRMQLKPEASDAARR